MNKLRLFCQIFILILCGASLLPVARAANPPRRVISFSPNITESVFAIGAGAQLVGVSDFCNWPPQARALKRCGAWSNPNYEVLSALHPDLILVLGQHQKVREFGRERGIAVEGVTMDSPATILAGLTRLGQLLDHEREAAVLTGRIKAELAAFKADLDMHPTAHRPTVLISIGRKPGALAGILTANGGCFLDAAVTLAGGQNVFGDSRQFYPQVSKESLLVRRPEVILELTGGVDNSPAQQRALKDDWQALPSIPAVRDGRIYILPQDFLAIPGPRLSEIIRTFRAALFPATAATSKRP